MKWLKPALFLAVIALGFSTSTTYAAEVFETFESEPTFNQALTTGVGVEGLSQGTINFAQTGVIGAFQLRARQVGDPTDSIVFSLYSGGSEPETGSLVASSTFSGSFLGYDYSTTTFVFNSPHTITSTSTNYWATLTRDSAGSSTQYYEFPAASPSTISGQSMWRKAGTWIEQTTQDLGTFSFLGEVGTIEYIFPANITLTGDFVAFEVGASFGAGEIDMKVFYATSTANLNATSTRFEDSLGLSSAGFQTINKAFVVKTNPLEVGRQYFSRAVLDVDSNQVAQTDIFSFIIGSDSFIDNLVDLLSSSSVASSTPSSIGSQVLNTILGFRNQIASKPPFGYITLFSSAISDNLSTSTTSTLNLAQFSGISFFSDIRDMFEWLLWLIFGFWGFKKFSNLIL